MIIKKGPIPGKVIPKLDTKLDGSNAPEIKGVRLIKTNSSNGYINFVIAESLRLMKFN